jgi:putative ABC transport system permease protein
MTLRQALEVALRALRVSLLRSFLTALGIIIGVSSIVTVLAIGKGAQLEVAKQMKATGANLLLINPGAAREGAVRLKAGTKLTLTESDVAALLDQIPEIQAAAGSLAGTTQIVHGSKNWNTTVNGTTSNHFLVRDWELTEGRFFSYAEEAGAAKVAILGPTVARELFGHEDPIGTQIRIKDASLEVVGVLDRKSPDQDDIVFVPLSTAKLRFLGSASGIKRDAVAYVIAKVQSGYALADAKSEIEALLRQRHHIPPGQEDDFNVLDPAAAMQAQQGAIRTVALLLISIASVSLIVGGISIMNIMIVSITERTREIGIRRALGGRMRDIRLQFLCEALVLCVAGGALGVASGIGFSLTVARMAGWLTAIDMQAVGLAVSFSVATGLIFGFYPAYRASKLNPIDALRAE